jgi:hypothetical protein
MEESRPNAVPTGSLIDDHPFKFNGPITPLENDA